MTAKEFLESNGIKYDHEATGMSTYVQNAGSTINAMEQMLEEYHQAKLKLLGIANVVAILPSDDEIEKEAEENASRIYTTDSRQDTEWYATAHGFMDGAYFIINKLSGN